MFFHLVCDIIKKSNMEVVRLSLRFHMLLSEQEALQMNALQLAYIGDSVWEMIVRFDLITRKYNVRHMHKECVDLVNAHSQAQMLQNVLDILDSTETEVVRRGRNAHAKHAAPRNQDPDDYAASTGFEALFGFLYLTGRDNRIGIIVNRIREVKNHAGKEKAES